MCQEIGVDWKQSSYDIEGSKVEESNFGGQESKRLIK